MTGCSVKNCKSRYDSGVSSHFVGFPTSNDPRRSIWIKFCARNPEWIPKKNSRICSLHFSADEIIGSRNKHATSTAIPKEPLDQEFKRFQDESAIQEKESDSEISESEVQTLVDIEEDYRDPLLLIKNIAVNKKKILEQTQLRKPSCRACLSTAPVSFISLYAKFKGDYVADMLSFCTNLEMERNDDFPQFICDECFKKLKFAKQLKDVCIQSDLLLKQENIKQEEFEDTNGFNFDQLIEFKVKSERVSPKVDVLSNKTEIDPTVNSKIFFIQELKPNKIHSNVLNRKAVIFSKSIKSTERTSSFPVEINKLKVHGKKVHDIESTEDTVPTFKPKCKQLKCMDCKKLYNADLDHYCFGKKICSICEKEFESNSYLTKHLNVFHVNDRECKVCQHKLTSAKNLHYHIKTHQEGCSFICDVCGNAYCSRSRLKIHRLHHFHSHTCDICGIIVSTRGSIIRHMIFVHLKNHEKIMCTECGLSFNNIQRLQQHQMRKHDAPSNIQCETCGMKFVYPSSLKNHILLRHHKVQPYSENGLQTGTHSCNICSKTFKLHSYLIKHKVMHSVHNVTKGSLDMIKRFKCDQCSKMFKSKHTKEEHQRTHSKERPYKCELCNKDFKIVKTLRNHLKVVHLQIRPYVSSKPNNCPDP